MMSSHLLGGTIQDLSDFWEQFPVRLAKVSGYQWTQEISQEGSSGGEDGKFMESFQGQ